MTDDDSVRAALAAAGELDAVVSNAALSRSGPIEGFPLDRFIDVMDTNTYGPLRIAQALIPAWRERGSGVFVHVSSVQGRVATPLEGAYAASKYALEALSETMHYELAHFGIRVVIIEPGYIAPGMKPSDDHTRPAPRTPSCGSSGTAPTPSSTPTGGPARSWSAPRSPTRSRTRHAAARSRSGPTRR